MRSAATARPRDRTNPIRAGELLREMAERNERASSKDTLARGSSVKPREAPKLADLGVTKTQSSRWQKLETAGGSGSKTLEPKGPRDRARGHLQIFFGARKILSHQKIRWNREIACVSGTNGTISAADLSKISLTGARRGVQAVAYRVHHMSKPKMGRPSKEEALHKAIAAFGGEGIPYELVDPRNILAAIAADPASSESARIRACVVLMGGDIGDYTRRKAAQVSDEALRRQWDEADGPTRAAMVECAKATCMGLLDA